MLTRIIINNFKTLKRVDIELGQNVVFIGPNNSGKTSALQALSLWSQGAKLWRERRGDKAPGRRPGITVNRRDLTHTPVADSKYLWFKKDINIHSSNDGTRKTQPIFIDISVEGIDQGKKWSCGLEFYYANSESVYCRPLRPDREPVPEAASAVQVALLPPMSGLVAEEPQLQPGAVNVLIGQGQTAQVLRNLCLRVFENDRKSWEKMIAHMRNLFGVGVLEPMRNEARGSIDLSYKDQNEIVLDLASSGRGLQQTLLILSYLYSNQHSVLLLDEPDAHLEILRQRQTYDLIVRVAHETGSQIIAASHSEVVLNEAADRDTVVAFVGEPHRVNDRGTQLRKALREVGYESYYLAEITGYVMYFEGATDLDIMRRFAEKLRHPALELLQKPFVQYVADQPKRAQNHFYAVREAKPDLVGFALFDRLERDAPTDENLVFHMWQRREIENYFISRDVLIRYAAQGDIFDLVDRAEREVRIDAMTAAIGQIEEGSRLLKRDPWSHDIKISEQTASVIFELYFEKLNIPNVMLKGNFHELVEFLDVDEVADEVKEVLGKIAAVGSFARPRS